MVLKSYPGFRFPIRLFAQLGMIAVFIFFFVMSAVAQVQAPQQTTNPGSPAQANRASPTVTPSATRALPTRTVGARVVNAPRSVPGQPSVDANTVALYRFDSPNTVAIDATGNYTGTLIGNATTGNPSLYSGVLSLDGNRSYVRTGHLGNLPQGTIELFVDFAEACQQSWYFTILSVGGEFGTNQTALVIRQQIGLMFGIYRDGTWHWADSGINACRYLAGPSGPLWPYETWRFHHVAVTWGPRGMEIWVNGVLHGIGTDADDSVRPYKYKCNPQMQMGIDDEPPNPLYPVCRTPVPAPTMPAYPPGAYTGPLPSYTTVLIGCGSDGSCFKGRIDEVRISNIQRTFHWTVVPTVTPTPTQTPVPLVGEYTVDGNTLALYHLNSRFQGWHSWFVYDEVSQSWGASLNGNATITSGGQFNQALWLDGDGDYVQLPNKPIQSNGTVEMWINLSSVPGHFAIFSAGNTNGSDVMYLGLNRWVGNTFIFSVLSNSVEPTWYTVDSGFRPIPGCWHHVAGTWGARGLQIWIDGSLRSVYGYYGAPTNFFERVLIGCNNGLGCTPGLIDEVRISNVQRAFTRAALARALTFSPMPRSLALFDQHWNIRIC